MSAETIFKSRRYLHFDESIGETASRELATNPQRVKTWAFMPMLKCVLVTKKVKRGQDGALETKEKERPICYSGHKDAAIYAYYGSILSVAYEELLAERNLSSVVTGFRPESGKCNIHFAKEAFDWIRSKGECTALAFDIKSFFDTLDHQVLKKQWASVLGVVAIPDDHYAVFKSITRFAWVLRDKALKALGISKHNPRANRRKRLCTPEEFRTKIREAGLIEMNPEKSGIPQGSPMSAVLSNIYMLEFDAAVQAKVESVGGLYRRYCDDMLCIVPPEHGQPVEDFVMAEIKRIKLDIQAAKTMRHHFKMKAGTSEVDKALQYLGFLFDGQRVLLRNAGLSRFYSRMRSGVRLAAATKSKADRGSPDKEADANPIKRKKLNTRYSYLGGRNFVAYAMRAAAEFDDPAIKKQLRRHWRKLNKNVEKAEQKVRDRRKKGT